MYPSTSRADVRSSCGCTGSTGKQAFDVEFNSSNAQVSAGVDAKTYSEKKSAFIALTFNLVRATACSVGPMAVAAKCTKNVQVGMVFENTTGSSQVVLHSLNTTYTSSGASNHTSTTTSADASSAEISSDKSGLNLAAKTHASYQCKASLTYKLSDVGKKSATTLTSMDLDGVQAQAFVSNGTMDQVDSSTVCPGSASGNTTGVYIGAAIAAFAALFLVIFSCRYVTSNASPILTCYALAILRDCPLLGCAVLCLRLYLTFCPTISCPDSVRPSLRSPH